MSQLADTFARVQAIKDEPWEPPAELVATISRRFREDIGREISTAELMTTMDGLGWVLRMVGEHDLDLSELMRLCSHLEATTLANITRVRSATGQPVVLEDLAVGLGSGFFTGLWIGMLLR